jgi:pantoate--beta-alanine ligase
MDQVYTVETLRAALQPLRKAGQTLALVPTMGALHDGHMALVECAKRHADHVVVSIFVNPKQFGPKEDFAAYPRPIEADAALLKAADVAVLWNPDAAVMYPDGYATTVSVAGLGDRLCGAARPGHFDGVCTVVTKLFNQVRPDIAVFGEKDWQQLAIIRRFTRDLDLGINIIGLPTQREADGLARSSRNAYLSAKERAAAVAIPRTLRACADALLSGQSFDQVSENALLSLESAGFHTIDYLSLIDEDTLLDINQITEKTRLLVAARIGKTRLIDNIAVSAAKI